MLMKLTVIYFSGFDFLIVGLGLKFSHKTKSAIVLKSE